MRVSVGSVSYTDGQKSRVWSTGETQERLAGSEESEKVKGQRPAPTLQSQPEDGCQRLLCGAAVPPGAAGKPVLLSTLCPESFAASAGDYL